MPFELPPDIASSVPAEHLNHASIQRYNSVPELIKGHVELQDYRGRSIAMPNGESKPEEFDKWATEQGAKLKDHGYTISRLSDRPPESPDAYEFKVEGVTPEAIKNDKGLAAYRNAAHKLGINQAQASGLFDVFAKEIYPVMQQPAPEFIEGEAVTGAGGLMEKVFKSESKQRLEEYKGAVNILQQTVPELKDMLNDGVIEYEQGKMISLGDHPGMIKLLSEIGRLMAQDFGGNITSAQIQAANDAQAEIDKIRNDATHPMHAGFLKGDKAVGEHMSELYKKLTGGK
jgi:hypothetical protein